MNPNAIRQAAALLIEARRTSRLLDALPAECKPASVDDAHAIQDATVAGLGETVAGWKIGSPIDGQVVRGVLLQSRIFASGDSIEAARMPMLGVEAEIAFRFERDLPPRERDYDYAEIVAAVTAFVAIEVVDSRFRSYRDAPLIERIADCISNGGFVQGTPQPKWRDFDLSKLEVELSIDGASIVRRTGGHPAVDPLLPAFSLANALRTQGGVRAGQVMTTGTFTGMNYAKPGQTVRAAFEGFGAAEVRFV